MTDQTAAQVTAPERPPKVIPPHVPSELVVDIMPYLAANDLADPFSRTRDVYETLPPIFFSFPQQGRLFQGTWVVTHYEDIREVYQNDALYSTADAANFQALVGETFRMIPLAVDPPEHGKYRILLNPWFSPKAITQMEPRILATINGLIDSFIDQGECDVAYDFGRLYPVRVFMDLMGFPAEKLEEFLAWEYAILHSHGELKRIQWGISSALAYLRSFIEEMRREPGDNLTSHIVHGQIEGRPLTDDEIIGTVAFLWLGGLDTVAATTSLMFRRLAREPELQQTLRDDPSLIPDAIEEFLRMQPLVNSTRLVKEDHEIHGVKIQTGDHIMAFNSAGNFDAAEFSDPRSFKLDRPSNRHFTLAGGPHRCLGSHLARRELRLALGEFLRRVPPFSVKPGADTTAFPGLIAVPRLPLVWPT
ncbi:MAG: cytochrome [Phenylobacterium sp.]|nr:cytochrome [Phenylobacterium sp.]